MRRGEDYLLIFSSMIMSHVSGMKGDDLDREIRKMSASISDSIHDDINLNKKILELVYGDKDFVDNDEINHTYAFPIHSAIQKAIENAIKKIVFAELLKNYKSG